MNNQNLLKYGTLYSFIYFLAATGTTIGCIIADILGALGICSAINAAAVASTAAGIETEIANVKAELDRLEEVFTNAEDLSNTLVAATNRMQKHIQYETNLIIVWEDAVDSLDGKMKDAYGFLSTKLPLKREVFKKAVLELRQAAEEYSKQPDFITELDEMFLKL